jgi:hypothetical protein
MAKHLLDKTGYLEACQNHCEGLVAILWIQLKINGSCRRGQKELILNVAPVVLGVPVVR